MKEIDYLSYILQFGAISIQLLTTNNALNDNPYPIMGPLPCSFLKEDHIILHPLAKLGYLDIKYQGFDDLN